MTTSLKSLIAGSMIAAAALTAAVGAAEAHGKHRSGLFIGLGRSQPDCSFYYWKWMKTGKFKWQAAYYKCVGIW